MKKNLIGKLFWVLAIVCSCYGLHLCMKKGMQKEAATEHKEIIKRTAVGNLDYVYTVEIEGHLYLVMADGRYGTAITHAEHCHCKNK